jgi:hypothetical protein
MTWHWRAPRAPTQRRTTPRRTGDWPRCRASWRTFCLALERIDRACIDDDLMALEINVEVLNEQLGRGTDRDGA